MGNKRRFSLKFVIFFPLFLFVAVMIVTAKNYYDAMNRYITLEYAQIDRALNRAIKVLTALDYSFVNYSNPAHPLFQEHNDMIRNGMCYVWPIDVLLLENKHSGGLPAVELDYMIVGQKELCEQGSALFNLAEKKAGFAPSLSFLHDIESPLSVFITSTSAVMQFLHRTPTLNISLKSCGRPSKQGRFGKKRHKRR